MPNYFMVFEAKNLAAMKLVRADIMPIPQVAKPEYLFTSEDAALKYAEKKAIESPGSLTFVMRACDVVEAGRPPLIHKTYNNNGELVPK